MVNLTMNFLKLAKIFVTCYVYNTINQGCAIVSLLRGILVLILHYYNSIGIVIEIGTAKKPRTILLLVLVLQFKLSQYWYWYCYWKTHSVSIDIGIVIARHLQQILPTLLVLQNNFSSIEERIASEIPLSFEDNDHLQMQNAPKGYPEVLKMARNSS